MEKEIEEIIDNISNLVDEGSDKEIFNKLKFIFKYMNEFILIQDLNFNILYVSSSVKRIMGYAPEEIIGKNITGFLTEKSQKKAKKNFIWHLEKAQQNKDIKITRYEYKYYRKNGSIYWGEITSKFIYNFNGEPIAYLGIIRDITERKNKEEELENLSFHDQLTGLYNRRYFENELDRLNNSRRLPIILLMGDIDNLKLINDNYGHKYGDKCIKKIAEIIEEVTREEDIVARISGDEFAIILPETDSLSAQKICKRINDKCEQVNKSEELKTPISITLGYAVMTDSAQNLDKVFKEADRDMYKNKNKC